VSREIRPEVRRWGPSAGVLVATGTATDLLAALSQAEPELAMDYADDDAHDVYRVRWPDGMAILDRFAQIDERTMSFAIAEVEELRGKVVASQEDAIAFFQNLRACAESWRAFVDPDDGSFELLIDA